MDFPFDVPIWFAMAVGGLIVVTFLLHALRRLGRWLATIVLLFFLRHCAYPLFWHRFFRSQATRLDVLILLLYLAGNGVASVLYVHSWQEFGVRTGIMAAVNLPLLLPGPLSIVADSLGMNLSQQTNVHQGVGWAMVLQATMHSAFQLATHGVSDPRRTFGIIASVALASLAVLSVPPARGGFYETFFFSHLFLFATITAALWLHIGDARSFPALCVKTSTIFWLASSVLQWTQKLYRSRSFSRGTRVDIVPLVEDSSCLQVDVELPRPWTIRAGQYLYLTVPRASLSAIFQRHPFMISTWGPNKVSLLVQRRDGFTDNLGKLASLPRKRIAFVDGPYGSGHDYDNYGTVLMFASDIGIASHLPYIQQLLEGRRNCGVRTRYIILVWQVDQVGREQWGKDKLTKLLKMDRELNLLIDVFVADTAEVQPHPSRRIEFHGGKIQEIDVDGFIRMATNPKATRDRFSHSLSHVLQTVMKKFNIEGDPDLLSLQGLTRDREDLEPWKIAIAGLGALSALKPNANGAKVCADARLRTLVRRSVTKHMTKNVRLFDMDFDPPSTD